MENDNLKSYKIIEQFKNGTKTETILKSISKEIALEVFNFCYREDLRSVVNAFEIAELQNKKVKKC